MDKLDFKKQLQEFYKPSSKHISIVDVPALNFLRIEGIGEPGCPAFQQAIEALYSVSYTIKFTIKKSEQAIDYSVMPLQGLWWADDMNDFIENNRSTWQWDLMIMQPDFVTTVQIEQAIQQVAAKKSLPDLEKLRFETFVEGKAAQILHVGPFAEEGPTVEKVHQAIAELNGKLSGKHHEIYLSDFRRAAPRNLKTIIRQPFSV